jgi:hypothetical protein
MKKLTTALALAATICAGSATAQTSNTIVAKFGKAPGGANFTVLLENKGPGQAVSGFAFRVAYDPAQASFDGVSNSTGQATSGVQYTLGPVKEAGTTGGAKAYRILTMTTLKNIEKAPSLVELKFTKKANGPFVLVVDDREKDPVDGVQDASFNNIPHEFDLSAVAGAAL